ncbi:MAG: hypothetical protein E6Q50_17885 [Lysobacter sp.]|nr:MAG: hypothetical protein E6Q50_17885 [Lysobacter sp.]
MSLSLLLAISGLGIEAKDNGASTLCSKDSIVCAYSIDRCAVYVARLGSSIRAIADCDDETMRSIASIKTSKTIRFKLKNAKELVLESGSVAMVSSKGSRVAKLYAYWSGTPENMMPFSTQKGDFEYLLSIREKICASEHHGQQSACLKSARVFFQGGLVGARDGQYWFDFEGKMLPKRKARPSN